MKKILNFLLVKVIIAITLGIILGQFIPESIGRIFATFNQLFSTFLGFAIPLIIIGLIVPAIGKLGKGSGKLLFLTAAIAYGSTLFSGFSTYFASIEIFPGLLANQTTALSEIEAHELLPYFSIEIPVVMSVMTALVLSFIIGIGISRMKDSVIERAFDDFGNIITGVINNIIIPLLPLFIFGIFLSMTYSGEVFTIVNVFIKIIWVIFIFHIILLILQFSIAGLISKKNPIGLITKMLPAYFTALGTQSSAATIPVTLRQVLEMGVSKKIAGFVVPLCATIHLAGSTLKIVACAVALMLIQGEPIITAEFAGFIFMLGIIMIAAPGVPGGAIMAALGILESMLGFSEKNLALIISLYVAMDSFGTACNVAGDCAIAVVINKFSKDDDEEEDNVEEIIEVVEVN